jgi:hypothetical protein
MRKAVWGKQQSEKDTTFSAEGAPARHADCAIFGYASKASGGPKFPVFTLFH